MLLLYVNFSVICLNFAPKWSVSYFQPILAAIFVTIATVKVKITPDHWVIVLINQQEELGKKQFLFLASYGGQNSLSMHVAFTWSWEEHIKYSFSVGHMHFQEQYDYDHFYVCCTVKISVTWTEGYKTCFMFNPTEHKILKNMIIFCFQTLRWCVYHANKWRDCYDFITYEHDKFHAHLWFITCACVLGACDNVIFK